MPPKNSQNSQNSRNTKSKTEISDPQNHLVGHYFHSIDDTGKLCGQGQIMSRPEPGLYCVEFFEWISGQASVRQLVQIEDMMSWLFYTDAEWMKFSYEYGVANGFLTRQLMGCKSPLITHSK